MSEQFPDGELCVTQQIRQRLEALRRSGVVRIPRMEPRVRVTATSSIETGLIDPNTLSPSSPSSPMTLGVTAIPRRNLFDEAPEPTAVKTSLPLAQRVAELEVIADQVHNCPRCTQLVAMRKIPVPGEGNPGARLMFLGEAPGADEDRTGRPFVGRAGQLLNDMITKGMGLKRENVFITNTIKCRPPENRVPLPDEVANCRGYLDRQIEIIQPDFLCLLGKTAALAMLGFEPSTTMGKLRGRWFDYKGIRTLVTYHPAYLLRNPAGKKDAWEDLKLLMAAMGIEPPRREKP